MNKIYKVIWNEARNAYVVVSEIAKNHGSKSCSTKKLLTMLIATGVMTCASMAPAMADNPAPNDLNVTIGKGAHVSVWNGVTGKNISGDIAVGPNAHAWNGEYTYENGKGFVAPRIGTKEYMMDFGQGAVEAVSDPWILFLKKTNYKVADGSKIAGSIAIGKNTVARTGSVMLGDHSYTGNLGDIEINPANAMTYNDGIYSTTLGAGAYNSGSLAAVTGALSIASGKDTKNTGATIYGSLNSIESATSNSIYSGVASSVLGFANRTQNANAALIWGTGNEVTNSIEKVGIDTNWNNVSVAEAQQKAIKAMQSSDYAGGSVMAIGGGNKADYAKYSQLTGVKNKVTGTKAKAAKYDFVNGYQNTVFNASDVTVIGIKNEVTADGNKVIGDNHKVSGKDNVIFGSADQLTETTVNNAVVLGHNAKVTGEGGVALGAGSVADRANAVSVGSKGAERQIINVAAGTANTDAVNVSQLKKVSDTANAGWNLSTNGFGTEATNVKPGGYVDFSGDDENITVSKEENEYATLVKVNLNRDLNVDSVHAGDFFMNNDMGIGFGGSAYITKNGLNANDKVITNVAAGVYNTDAVNVGQLKKVEEVAANANKGWNLSTNGFGTEATNVKPGDYVDFSGDKNISVSHDGTKVKVELNKDIDVNSVKTNALNSKYNLSVGTMAENGIMPFLVNSTGAFYAANNNFSVDKDGKVIATAGEIGNVVLQNGVYTGNSALRDGELYVGDADGNYSQITPKSAKLGQVTIDEKGNIAGVNSIQTNALNAKYNLSVGTMAENGIMPFLVNSTGAFYAANNNFSVDKDGKVIATAGEIGNVVLQNGVYTGNSALRDGELYVGDASGNYSQITTTGAKLGQVTIAADGKISGVAAGEADTDAVNVSQLQKVSDTANAGWNLSTNGVATEATNVKPGDFVDFSGDKNISVSHNGTKVQVKLNENIDVNSIKTNALNSKYNLSVGTMAENGIMPFLVSSTGAFYAANNNFSVDKDGKVIATAGKIGNVVLKNGVYTGNSALRDGELYLGDASGNYSQITTTGAKLGQVTIAADGKISGVAAGEVSSTSTDAINGSQLHAVATEAGKHTTLSNGKNTTVESTVKDGQTDYKVNVAGDLTDITSVANGDSKINLNKDSIIISNGNKYFAITNSGIGMSYIGADYSAKSIMLGENGTTISGGLNVAGSKITGVAAGVEKTDAVNVGQLKDYVAANDTHIKSGNYAVGEVTDSTGNKSQGVSMDIVNKEGKVTGTVTITDVAKASDVGNVNNIDRDIQNQDDSHTTVVDAVNNLNQKLDNKVGDLNYVEGGKGNYVTNGENTTTSIGKLDQALKDVAATAAKHTTVTQGDNITVTPGTNTDGSKNYNVALKKDITVESVTANTFKADQTVMNKDGLKVGNKVSVSATAVTAGQTSISNDGLKVNGKTYVSDSGLNANDQKITNVADGKVEKGSTDAVNGGQLYNETRVAKDGNFVKKSNTAGENLSALDNQVTANTESIYHMNGRISDLDNRVNKVGAGAAALAALHPLDFDPDAKWDFAAGYGNYRGANAAAVGAYYRPNEDTMFSVGGTFGNGENMVNAGVSFKLGSGSSHVSTSRVAMAKEIKELRGELEAMKSAMLDANAGKKIDTSKLQLFPDVPQNHWAYEYVAQLAGNGMIEGYPDGNFAGDRPMTRYEFAAILYRAMTKGAVLSDKILSEFSHELEYFTVDTIAKDKAGNPTIQRVRTVKENKNK